VNNEISETEAYYALAKWAKYMGLREIWHETYIYFMEKYRNSGWFHLVKTLRYCPDYWI